MSLQSSGTAEDARPTPGQPPVFILAPIHRSGTNWLAHMLVECGPFSFPDPRVIPGEDLLLKHAHLLGQFSEGITADWGTWIADVDDLRRRRDDLMRHFGLALRGYLAQYPPGPGRLLVKSPFSENIDLFHDLFPDSPLVILIRDGRDVVESSRRSWPGDSYETWMERWAGGADRVLQFLESPAGARAFVLKFEDVVRDARSALTPLLDYLQVSPEVFAWDRASRLPVYGSSTSSTAPVWQWQESLPDADFQPVGRWRSWPPELIERFWAIGGPQLTRLGYHRELPAGSGEAAAGAGVEQIRDPRTPKVTVVLTTYNHEPFIRQAIDSILVQETTFRFDLVIIEDRSTDRTREIVVEYARQHPDRIRLVLPDANRCDNVLFMQEVRQAAGEYVALLDGDDYWTSPHKLQRQVEYLDRHPGCAICCHNALMVYEDGSHEPRFTSPPDQKATSTIEDLFEGCFVITCSVLMRKNAVDRFPARYAWEKSADWALFTLAAGRGTIGYLDDTMAVYRQHRGGFWTGLGVGEQQRRVVEFYENARDYVPPEHLDAVAVWLARACCDLGAGSRISGDMEDARAWFSRALLAEPDLRRVEWRLRTAGGCAGDLSFPPDRRDAVRLSIDRLDGASHDLQLNLLRFRTREGETYRIRFEARADGPRPMCVGVARARDAWDGLGFFRQVALTTAWQRFDDEFTCTEDWNYARVHFDLGESATAVEIAGVRVTAVGSGETASLYRTAEMSADEITVQPLVSVVIPYLNAGRFLREAVESVVTQGYQRWELLLVDDGSTDDGPQIAEEYLRLRPSQVSCLEHRDRRNLGISASRNLGVRHARGEFIAFLDADDVWLAGKLEEQVRLLQLNPEAAMVVGSSLYWHGWTGDPADVQRDYVPDPGIPTDHLYHPPDLARQLYPLGYGTPAPPSDWLLRREAIHAVGGFEEEFRGMYEDQAFLVKLHLAFPVFVSGRCWDRYRIHQDSCMATSDRAGEYNAIRAHFLNWFDTYLRCRDVVDDSVRTALDEARRTDRSTEGTVRAGEWMLRTGAEAIGGLIAPPRVGAPVRVAIERAPEVTWDLQLNRPYLRVSGNERYTVEFRARADGPRTMGVGFAQAHQPWENLGWFEVVELTAEWRAFRAEFTATADDVNARIHFDLGGSPESVEIAAARLMHGDEVVEPSINVPSVPPSRPSAGGTERSVPGEAAPPPGQVDFGSLRRLTPVSTDWGLDRGLPVDRHYVRGFLARHASAIAGRVLEVGDDSYTREFGRGRVARSDVLHVTEGHPGATIVADLTCAPQIPTASFDCILLTQTLQFVYDVRAAIATVHRILKPGGVVLATVPGISQNCDRDWSGHWCWNFTPLSAQRLFEDRFAPGDVRVEAFGNVLAATAFLQGLAAQELSPEELDYRHPGYDVTIAVRAMKSEQG